MLLKNSMRISVIIPVRDEEERLPEILRHIRRTATLLPTEVIVVDGRSRDGSFSIARDLADRAIPSSRTGRAFQMHQGALAASGELLLFLHADTRLPESWQACLAHTWQKKDKPIATAFRLSFDHPAFFYRCIARTAHWRTLCTRIPHGDQAIALERRIYFSVGGFPDVPLMEEYCLFQKLKPLGRVKILPERVFTSVRRYEKNGRLLNNLRNTLLVLLFYCGFPPRLLARLYR